MDFSILEQKKAIIDSHRPFPKEVIHNLDQWFEVELTYSSNALEGNTRTRVETALVLEKGLTVGGKPMKDHIEAINHKKAIEVLKNLLDKKKIDLEDILYLHKIILSSIDDDNAGTLRTVPVRISGSNVILPNHAKVPRLMESFIQMLNAVEIPVLEKAIQAHYEFVTIHPFTDGNGRTGRLLMNLILMKGGYPPAIILPKDRLSYIKSLEKAQLGGPINDYEKVMEKAIDRSLDIYLKALGESPQKSEKTDLLKIGQLSKATLEAPSTLRYWTKMGLLSVETTTDSGYQLYSQEMIQQAKQIRTLQNQRYSLEEILSIIQK